MKKLIVLCTALACTSYAAGAGWRAADKEDMVNDWARFPGVNKITADFNGDGKKDTAQILLRQDGKQGFKAVVNMSIKGKPQQFVLKQMNDIEPQSMALEIEKPSIKVKESACEKGYWDCKPGEIRQFKVTSPIIMLCAIEVACSLYVWSPRSGSFKEIPVSD